MKKQMITFCCSSIFFLLIITSTFSENTTAAPGWINVATDRSVYYEGDSIIVTWSSFDIGDYVKIELFRGGRLIFTISDNTSNDGSYSWTIPSGYTSIYSYTIKVTDIEYPYDYDYSGFFFIYEKLISIKSPTINDLWYKGSSHIITWDSENTGNYMRIELYKSGVYYSIISSSTYNDGWHSWLISSTISSGSDYQIKITCTTDSSTYDYSDYFTIDERSITITTPASDEVWYKGEKNTITWSSKNAGSSVKIQYKFGSTHSWNTIDSSTSNTGNYEWTIPSHATLSSLYQIRITSNSYSNVYDISSFFTIDERYIKINSPNRYDIWYPNETHTISWTTKNAGNIFDIRLVKNDVHCAWIAKDLSNTGSYLWSISDVFASDSTYQVEIRSRQFSSVYDLSDMFSIGKRSIQIISPEAEITLYAGDYLTINWESEEAGNTVEIELYKEGQFYLTIDSYVPSSGSYSWRISTDIPESSSYQIRIASSSYSDVYGYSAGNFSISQNIFQKAITPLIILVITIGVLAVSSKVIINYRKKRNDLPDKKTIDQHKLMQTQTQFNQNDISQEEYENIWEGGNL